MIPVCIRLVFKIAELVGHEFHGKYLSIGDYTRYNAYLVVYGPGIIVDLEMCEPSERKEMMWEMMIPGSFDEKVPRMHDELIRFLETRGSGLMTDPGIEIQQFFQEEDTILDTRG
jgi:hypothetical protein